MLFVIEFDIFACDGFSHDAVYLGRIQQTQRVEDIVVYLVVLIDYQHCFAVLFGHASCNDVILRLNQVIVVYHFIPHIHAAHRTSLCAAHRHAHHLCFAEVAHIHQHLRGVYLICALRGISLEHVEGGGISVLDIAGECLYLLVLIKESLELFKIVDFGFLHKRVYHTRHLVLRIDLIHIVIAGSLSVLRHHAHYLTDTGSGLFDGQRISGEGIRLHLVDIDLHAVGY